VWEFVVKISENGIQLLKRFEGLELEAYQDIAGVWTIGYGHTGPDVQPGMKISERDAEELLRRDLKPREQVVDGGTKVSLNQNEFDALVSFVYNVGAAAYRGSTALKRLNKGDRIGAADALTWWNKATVGGVLREVLGLTRRRAAERALFLTPTAAANVRDPEQLDENTRATPIEDAPRRGNIAESRTVQGASIAGGAGVASSTLGRDNAEELSQIETNIENGVGTTENQSAGEGSTPPASEAQQESKTGGAPGADATEGTATGDGQMIEVPADRPSAHEVHTVEAQIQFALLILIILSVLFVIYARFDDWRSYKR
jgi:lysozyme